MEHLQRLTEDKDNLRNTRLFAFHAVMLGLSGFPNPCLIDGDEVIPLLPQTMEVTAVQSGNLMEGSEQGDNRPVIIDYANPPEPGGVADESADAPAEEDHSEAESSEESDDGSAAAAEVDEELDENEADDVVAGVISGEDRYGGEPPEEG